MLPCVAEEMRQDAEVRVTACSGSTKAPRSDAPCFPKRW